MVLSIIASFFSNVITAVFGEKSLASGFFYIPEKPKRKGIPKKSDVMCLTCFLLLRDVQGYNPLVFKSVVIFLDLCVLLNLPSQAFSEERMRCVRTNV